MIRHIRKGMGRARYDVGHALESLFVAETISASPEIWIVSPWISDVVLIDNRGGRYEHLRLAGERTLKISDVLVFMASRFETRITVVVSDHEWASEFRMVLPRVFKEKNLEHLLNFIIKPQQELHEKSITTSDWQVSGSMNFTKQGIDVKDEVVAIDTSQRNASEAIIDLRQRFPWKVA